MIRPLRRRHFWIVTALVPWLVAMFLHALALI